MATQFDLSHSARGYVIKMTLKQMTGYENIQYRGCIQGYWGHTFPLFMVWKRNEALFRRGLTTDVGIRTLRGSCIHWRQEAEKDLHGRLEKLFLKMSPFPG